MKDRAQAYLLLAKAAIASAACKEDLRQWWRDELKHRQDVFGDASHPRYAELFECFAQRGEELPETAGEKAA